MKPTIYQIEFIGSGMLAVMAKPVSGEWIDDEFAGIASAGIDQLVSLLETQEAREIGLHNERILCEKNAIKFRSYPIPDRGLPNSVSEFAHFTKELYHQIAGGCNTVIHCRAGIGRTGLVAAGVLLHCAFNPEQALQHISIKRGVEVPDTPEQRDWLVANYRAIVGQTA